jgi:hypothetical protein
MNAAVTSSFVRRFHRCLSALCTAGLLACGGAKSGTKEPAFDPAQCTTTIPATVSTNTTIGPGCVRLETTVVDGAVLTIAPGTTVAVAAGGSLSTLPSGDLVAAGTAAAPILFRSLLPTGSPGDWASVAVHASDNSELHHVTIRHGGAGTFEAALYVDAPLRALEQITVEDSSSHGVNFSSSAGVATPATISVARNARASVISEPEALLDVAAPVQFADADDAFEIGTGNIFGNGTLPAQSVPYRMVGSSLVVPGGNDLLLAAGVTLQLTGSGLLVDGGHLEAKGSSSAPVVFTSAKATPAPGDWGCVDVSVDRGAIFDHAVFTYAGATCGDGVHAAVHGSTRTTVTNSRFEHLLAGAAGVIGSGCGDQRTAFCANTFVDVSPRVVCGGVADVCP